MEKILNIEGMACNHCTSAVKECLEKIDGVKTANVSLEEKNAVVVLNKEIADKILKNAVENQGFTVTGIK
ncbi:MAG: heavy-metal-associated domain-containing protein [Ruminococcaceae bacterium]|nr:heavy-metal-associated domain-containing protein [Oscillospiraceae bacterium]